MAWEVTPDPEEMMRKKESKSKLRLVCPGCGCPIPIQGELWRYRAAHAKYDVKGVSHSYYCDNCADKRERGEDLY